MPPFVRVADQARILLRRLPFLRRWLRSALAPAWRHLLLTYDRRRTARYDAWAREHASLHPAEAAAAIREIAALPARALVSVLLPALGAAEALAGLETQLWPEWEAWVCHAPGTPLPILPPNPRLRGVAGPAEALARAEGSLLLLPAADARLRPDALLALVRVLGAHPEAWAAYADEDRIDTAGKRSNPLFKPAFDPDLLLALDYLGGLFCARTEALRQLGWNGEPAREVALCAAARDGGVGILHLPELLCHRRAVPEPITDHTALHGGLAAWDQALAEVLPSPGAPLRPRISWQVPAPAPRVSIIIPTRDRADLLAACVDSLVTLTDYPDFEVLICDNGSEEPATAVLFGRLAAEPRVRVLPMPEPFNYSRLNNQAAAVANGDVLVLLNNDTEVIEPNWLRELVALASRPGVGAVGARLLYPDGGLQHGGVLLGVGWPGGVAGHLFPQARPEAAGPHGLLQMVRGVSAVTAACLAVRRELYMDCGGLDEAALAVAFNDVDLCLRLGTAGYRNLWTPFATLVHKESASRGSDLRGAKAARAEREAAVMRQRWATLLDADPCWNPNLSLGSGEWLLAEAPRGRAPRAGAGRPVAPEARRS